MHTDRKNRDTSAYGALYPSTRITKTATYPLTEHYIHVHKAQRYYKETKMSSTAHQSVSYFNLSQQQSKVS